MVINFISQVNRLENEGYYGGVRLLMAICKVFYKYCTESDIELKKGNFTLSYDTNIPRQVKVPMTALIFYMSSSYIIVILRVAYYLFHQ